MEHLHPLPVGLPGLNDSVAACQPLPAPLVAEHEALRKLYDSLTDFGQDSKLPVEKLDYVKARVFDTTVLLNRINRSANLKTDI